MPSVQAQAEPLLPLLSEALRLCRLLLAFSEEQLTDLDTREDEAILSAIEGRAAILSGLMELEEEIKPLLDRTGQAAPPPEADRIRREIRSVLRRVSDIDARAMGAVSGKMRAYREETLKARSRKHLSAYMSAGQGGPSARGGDCNRVC